MKKIFLYFLLLLSSLCLINTSALTASITVFPPDTGDYGIAIYIIILSLVLIGGIALFLFRNKGKK